jgi:hypothetical protein
MKPQFPTSHKTGMSVTPHQQRSVLSSLAIVGSLLGLSCIATNPAQAFSLNTNLIANPGAELGLTDWLKVGGTSFTAIQYGTNYFGSGTNVPALNAPGPSNRGSIVFAGGDGLIAGGGSSGASFPFSFGRQTISLSPVADAQLVNTIDSGNAVFNLAGFFGGTLTSTDNASLRASFFGNPGVQLGSTVTIGAVTPVERNNITGLLARSTTGLVPIGTRNITLNLDMLAPSRPQQGGFGSAPIFAFADNLDLTISERTAAATAVPEPFTIVGTLLGGTAAMRLRKKLTSNKA